MWYGSWLRSRSAGLLSAYRRDDYESPKLFIIQVRMNLERYSQDVVAYVTDPVTGVQTKKDWPPSLSEIVKACEARASDLAMAERYRQMGTVTPRVARTPPLAPPGQDYDTMFKKHGRPFGPFEQGRQFTYNAKR